MLTRRWQSILSKEEETRKVNGAQFFEPQSQSTRRVDALRCSDLIFLIDSNHACHKTNRNVTYTMTINYCQLIDVNV